MARYRYTKASLISGLIMLGAIGMARLVGKAYEIQMKYNLAYRHATEELNSSDLLPIQVPEDGNDVRISDCATAEGMTSRAERTAYAAFVRDRMFGEGKVKIRTVDSAGNEFIRVRTVDAGGCEVYRNIEIPFGREDFLPKGIKLSFPDWNNDGSVGGNDYRNLSVRQRKDKDRSRQAAMRSQMRGR